MHLKILLPNFVFSEIQNVKRIVARTSQGLFGILPQRLDCVAALTPGIFTFETADAGEVTIAVDEGILVKQGKKVVVSVRNAIGDPDITKLKDAVAKEFLNLGDREREVRAVLVKIESGILRRFVGLHRE